MIHSVHSPCDSKFFIQRKIIILYSSLELSVYQMKFRGTHFAVDIRVKNEYHANVSTKTKNMREHRETSAIHQENY